MALDWDGISKVIGASDRSHGWAVGSFLLTDHGQLAVKSKEEGGLAMIAIAKQAVRYLSLVALLALASCFISEGPPTPKASIDVEIDLQPGATETYEFEISVEPRGAVSSRLSF